MKNFLKGCSFLVLLLLAACSNDFDLTADWKDIPVLYAIFDVNSDEHYIRVEKAFIDNNKSAIDIAQIPDSLYYDDSQVTVYIENENTGERLTATRIDGDDEGIPRAGGVFANQPNWLYKTTGALIKDTPYKVVVERSGREDAESFIRTAGNFSVTSPIFPQTFKFSPDDGFNIDYSSDNTVRYFNVSLAILYQIKNINTGAIEEVDTIVWDAVSNERIQTPNGQNGLSGTSELLGNQFFEFLGQNAKRIFDASGNEVPKIRTLKGAHIILEGGGLELVEFYEVLSANTGLTGAETVPTYTNVINGLGLVTSKAKTITEDLFSFKPNMEDDLQQHPATRDLNFTFF